MQPMKNIMEPIAVVGGGIMGVTLAYRLTKLGIPTVLYERGSNLGGLAAAMEYQGLRIDRFYHTILSSDISMHKLIEETGVTTVRHFTETKQGFYDEGKIYPFNTPLELMAYPPLNLIQRIRLGLQVLYAQIDNDWRKIDEIPVRDWLNKVSGSKVYEKVWGPLLHAKFDSRSNDVSATYIWSRLKRMMSTRQGVTSKEMMSYLERGYYTLIEAMVEQAKADGLKIRLNTHIEEILIEGGTAVGIRLGDGSIQQHKTIISTLMSPVLADLSPALPLDLANRLRKQQYLGVVCPLMILDRPLTPYYVVNITDTSIPFTAVVETTNLINPAHVGGKHLVYLPKYIAWESEIWDWDEETLRIEWLKHLKRMFPDFEETWIETMIVQKARFVEPLRPIHTLEDIPRIRTGVKGLYMGNTAMFYPELGNGEAITRFTEKILEAVTGDSL